jgi:hypothetical protein
MVQKIKINKIKTNPKNPRVIRDYKFDKLVKSIKEFPQMLKIRPIIIDENDIILGGNMRYKACIDAGLKEVYVDKIEDLTEKQKEEFIVKDNVNFGDWDWDILGNEWKTTDLDDWGLDVWQNSDDNIEMINKGDEFSEWVGMPEFEASEKDIKIIIAFATEELRQEFAEKHNMKFSIQGKKAWSTSYPFKEKQDLNSLKYE